MLQNQTHSQSFRPNNNNNRYRENDTHDLTSLELGNADGSSRLGTNKGHPYLAGHDGDATEMILKKVSQSNPQLLSSESDVEVNAKSPIGNPRTLFTILEKVNLFFSPAHSKAPRTCSVSTLAVLAVFIAVLMSSTFTAAIVISFSMKGARDIAESSSQIVTDGCRQRLSEAISVVTQAADVAQFSIAWDPHPLPSDDTAEDVLGCWRSQAVERHNQALHDRELFLESQKTIAKSKSPEGGKRMSGAAAEGSGVAVNDETNDTTTSALLVSSTSTSPISTPVDKSALVVQSRTTIRPRPSTNLTEPGSMDVPPKYTTRTGNGEGWYLKWHRLCLMNGRGTTFPLVNQMSMAFHDGSYTGCVIDRYNSSQIKGVHSRVNPVGRGFWYHNITYYHIQTGLPTSNMTLEIGSVDTRQRSWYRKIMDDKESNNGTIMYQKAWGAFTAAPNKYRASVALSFTMVNSTGQSVGIGTFNVGMDVFSDYIATVKPSQNAHVVLLDDYNRVMATSLGILPFRMRVVSFYYQLTADEVARGCVISDYHSSSSIELDRKELYCPITIVDTGYQPLIYLQRDHGKFLDSSVQCIGRKKLGDEMIWVSVAHVSAGSSDNVRWKVVILIPERDVTDYVQSGTVVSVMVSVVIVIVVIFVFALLLRWLLKPLAAIAKKMSTAAFLDDAASVSTSTDGKPGSSDGALGRKGEGDSDAKFSNIQDPNLSNEKKKIFNSARTLSYLSDVAAIQKAYWEMADELRILRGYIPEHICNELIQGRSPLQATDQMQIKIPTEKANTSHDSNSRSESFAGATATGATIAIPDSDATILQTSSREGVMGRANDTMAVSNLSAYNEVLGLPPPPCESVLVSSNEAAQMESLGGITLEEARRRSDSYNKLGQPVFFRDNVLIDRDISVAVVNIVAFHAYAQVTHGAELTKHHEAIVAYIHAVASKCGGVLETFSGDKFLISFNATTKCDASAIAAACFGLEVSSTMNREAAAAREALTIEHEMRVNNQPIKSRYQPRFRAALRGISVGVATGRAFVGPLGTSTIRRHSIISNAVVEAAVLERQSAHYPDCGVMVAGDMIPAIEGYMQYFILDACVLPGSGGLRRRLASIKGAMCAPGCNPSCLRGLSDLPAALQVYSNPYNTTNNFFNSFLEGRNEECVALMQELDTAIRFSKGLPPQEGCVAAAVEANKGPLSPAAAEAMLTRLQLVRTVPPSTPLTEKQCENVAIMLRFVWSLMFANPPIDGRRYKSPLGQINTPNLGT